MKQLLLAVVLSLVFAVACMAADIPNLEVSVLYDLQTSQVLTGLTSRMIAVGDVDLRVGYNSLNQGVCALGYDLENLEKLGMKIHYLWGDDVKTTVGSWIGFNFQDNCWGYGLLGVLIQANF